MARCSADTSRVCSRYCGSVSDSLPDRRGVFFDSLRVKRTYASGEFAAPMRRRRDGQAGSDGSAFKGER